MKARQDQARYYTQLLEYCETPTQSDAIQAVINNATIAEASRQVGTNERSFRRLVNRVKERAARSGVAPGHFNNGTAPGYEMAKVTIQRDFSGAIEKVWERQVPAAIQAAQILSDCLERLEYKPAPRIKAPKGKSNKDLLTLYTLTDYHLAMYSYGEETGEDWDTDIASRVMLNAIHDMADQSPDSEECILNLQGDFLHWDGADAVTPMSGHILDADTRQSKMIDLALQLTMQAIEILLKKHKRVKLLVCEGNHDMTGSVWMRKSMGLIFKNNPRVTVDNTDFPFYAHLHGKTMLAFHHGHKVTNKSLPALFASEPRYRSMWGQADYTYIHTGHYHRKEQDAAEGGGAITERHPTLAGRDAYAARGGYVSKRAALAITYHGEYGELIRITVPPREA